MMTRARLPLLAVSASLALAAAAAAAGCGKLDPNPKKLTFARQAGELTGTLGRHWKTRHAYDLDQVVVELTKTGGKGKAGVTVCRIRGTDEDTLDQFEVDGDAPDGKVFARAVAGVKGALIHVLVDGKSVANKFEYKLRLRRPDQGKIAQPQVASLPAVKGYADLHNHHMAHLAFGGGYLWGAPDKPLTACDGKSHGQLAGFVDVPGYIDGPHKDRTQPGTPPQADWPHFADPSHQQMHATHLQQARAGGQGLNLMVMYAVNSEWLAAASSSNDKAVPDGDMDSVRAQLLAAHRFAAAHPWYKIARDPWEARRIIAGGNLAVVLGVEVSNLMPEGEGAWADQLDELYDLGVRAMEIAHETDSDFAGSAMHDGVFLTLANALKRGFKFKAQDGKNLTGLTPRGEALVDRMVARRMLIPLDHISRVGRKQLADLVKAKYASYPLHASHSRFDALAPYGIDDKEAKRWGEYMLTDANVESIRATGGIFALRTGPSAVKASPGCPVANSCNGSTRSFAQLVHYGTEKAAIQLAFGTDCNGFVPLIAPRFAGGREAPEGKPAACYGHGTPDDPTKPALSKPLGRPFDKAGMAHIGYLPDVVADLKNLGVSTAGLEGSAEAFLKMWERCYQTGRKPLDAAGYAKMYGTSPKRP